MCFGAGVAGRFVGVTVRLVSLRGFNRESGMNKSAIAVLYLRESVNKFARGRRMSCKVLFAAGRRSLAQKI